MLYNNKAKGFSYPTDDNSYVNVDLSLLGGDSAINENTMLMRL